MPGVEGKLGATVGLKAHGQDCSKPIWNVVKTGCDGLKGETLL